MSNRVLITGATGMLGAYLMLELLKSGEKVRALKRENSNLSVVKKIFSYYTNDYEKLFSEIEWFNGDILDYDSMNEAMHDVSIVYHSAAIISFDAKDKRQIIYNNTRGTAHVVNAAIQNKIKKFCHVSSIAALGNAEENELITEESQRKQQNNQSGYSISKFNSEMEVWRGIAEGLNAVIVNPSVIIGAGDWSKGSPSIFKRIWKGNSFYTTGTTGYVDVRDVVKIMIQLTKSEILNQRFIISSENLSFKVMMEYVANSLHTKPPHINATPFILGLAWKFDKISNLLFKTKRKFTKDMAQTAVKQKRYSNKKIIDTLNYQFISVKDSIAHFGELFINDMKKG